MALTQTPMASRNQLGKHTHQGGLRRTMSAHTNGGVDRARSLSDSLKQHHATNGGGDQTILGHTALTIGGED